MSIRIQGNLYATSMADMTVIYASGMVSVDQFKRDGVLHGTVFLFEQYGVGNTLQNLQYLNPSN